MDDGVYPITGGDYERGGSASRDLKTVLKRVGVDPSVIRRAVIAAYEAEMNVVIHARRGQLRFAVTPGLLDVEVADEGPGIADIDQAMADGFSTAGAEARALGFGAGMGLPNIRKSTDWLTIDSQPGRGTVVRFKIRFSAASAPGESPRVLRSVAVNGERCVRCLKCVRACPTQALRVRPGGPAIIEHLCIDCGACITACEHGTFVVEGRASVDPPQSGGRWTGVLVVPSAFLVQFGARATPEAVLEALAAIGFPDVRAIGGWERSLSDAVRARAAGARARPIISPTCPAVVNLIELRFPSILEHVAAFRPPIEAAREDLKGHRTAFAVQCPSVRTALVAAGAEPEEVATVAALRAAVAPILRPGSAAKGRESTVGPAADPASISAPASGETEDREVLRVTGLRHVMRVLDEVEHGGLGDVAVLEPFACDEGCFGGPLLGEEGAVARHRWVKRGLGAPAGRAWARPRPFALRPGLRLDPDMGLAIRKLARIEALTRELPGTNCGQCGAPTCAALAEDAVLGRVAQAACARRGTQGKTP